MSFAIKEGDAASPTADTAQAGAVGSAARVEQVIQRSRQAFRHCYNRGLLYDPTQDGHVAIVLRLAKDGRVAKTEAYGACDLSAQVLRCMMDSVSDLRFDPPAPGAESVTVPLVFRQGPERTREPKPNDVYTAEAFLALEAARPALHACESAARKANKVPVASATFNMDIDAQGKVAHAHIDPWSGDQDLLACAAEAMDKVGFPPPPGGAGHAIVRIAFNPRTGTK